MKSKPCRVHDWNNTEFHPFHLPLPDTHLDKIAAETIRNFTKGETHYKSLTSQVELNARSKDRGLQIPRSAGRSVRKLLIEIIKNEADRRS